MSREPAPSWSEFATRYWEKRPAVFGPPFGAALTAHRDIFPALVAAAEACRARTLPNRHDVRLFIDHAQTLDPVPYLPQLADGSLAAYGARVSAALDGRPFTLIVTPFQVFSVALWEEMRDFLGGAFDALGALPAGAADARLIVGTYTASPFGLHKDSAGVFTFVVEGHKRVLVWPFERLHHLTRDPDAPHKEIDLHGIDREQFRESAIVLEGEPGDVLYWPSTYWHAVESRGGLHVTLHLSSYLNGQPASSLARAAERLVSERLGREATQEMYPLSSSRVPQGASHMPAGMSHALDVFKDLAGSSSLERHLRLTWLSRLTASGFESVPAPDRVPVLREEDVVQADAKHPIAWMSDGEHEILCSANGHALILPAHPHLPTMLARLNTGEAIRVGGLMRLTAGIAQAAGTTYELSPDDVRTVLQKLCAIRGLRHRPRSASEAR